MAQALQAQGRLAARWRRMDWPRMRIIAHRGFRGCYPENTRSAFAASLGRSHMVELDVRLSLDGEVVVFHDDTLGRCSNAALIGPQFGLTSLRVDQWRLDQLRLLDLGSWFVPFSGKDGVAAPLLPRGKVPQSYQSWGREVLPTLAETLAWAKAYRMPLNIELKEQGEGGKNETLVRHTIRQVFAAGCLDLVLLSSFSQQMLALCRCLAPLLSRALLHAGTAPSDLFARLRAIDACAYHPEHSSVNAGLVYALRQQDYSVHAWTVNEPQQALFLQQCGVNGLITDYPCLYPVS
ncbi:MAG: hypothetical protein HQQ73_03335 [Desulfobulbaceae bacterium]|nr:hypothetical protein [Desulfobulbaceae bacterium]